MTGNQKKKKNAIFYLDTCILMAKKHEAWLKKDTWV